MECTLVSILLNVTTFSSPQLPIRLPNFHNPTFVAAVFFSEMEDATVDPADLDELIDASKGGKFKRINIIANKGRIPVNTLHESGWAAIHYAAQASQ